MEIKQYTRVFRQDQAFPLHVRKQIQGETDQHSHQFTEIAVIMTGTGLHKTQFSEYTVNPGDVLIIPKDAYHCYAKTVKLELINLFFDAERLPVPLIDLYVLPGFHALFSIKDEYFKRHQYYPRFHLEDEDFSHIKEILFAMSNENSQMRPGYRSCLLGYFMVLISKLSRLYTENLDDIGEPSFKIGQAVSFLNTRFQEKIELAEVIRNTGMSRSTFMRKFSQAIGVSPINYLLKLRINESCHLLLSTGLDVAEIAYRTGFNDSNYFTRQFTRMMGMSPRQFRKSNRHYEDGTGV